MGTHRVETRNDIARALATACEDSIYGAANWLMPREGRVETHTDVGFGITAPDGSHLNCKLRGVRNTERGLVFVVEAMQDDESWLSHTENVEALRAALELRFLGDIEIDDRNGGNSTRYLAVGLSHEARAS